MTDSRGSVYEVIIKNVLLSPQVQSIDFYIGWLHVFGLSYAAVANAISSGKIGLVYLPLQTTVAARYDFRKKQYQLPDRNFGFTPFDQVTIAHESTHAAVSMQYSTLPITDTLYEAAGYIAAAIYNRAYGMAAVMPLPQERIADLISQSLPRGGIVSSADEASLRQAIANRPNYAQKGITYNSYVYKAGGR